uniref:Uncharacterized protein n=1 Tax=Canis lupus dingo TaxID=286419 RepID=A0A8C0JPV1_CANLU
TDTAVSPGAQWSALFCVLGDALQGWGWWVIFWPLYPLLDSLGPLGPFTQYLVDHHHALLHNKY